MTDEVKFFTDRETQIPKLAVESYRLRLRSQHNKNSYLDIEEDTSLHDEVI